MRFGSTSQSNDRSRRQPQSVGRQQGGIQRFFDHRVLSLIDMLGQIAKDTDCAWPTDLSQVP